MSTGQMRRGSRNPNREPLFTEAQLANLAGSFAPFAGSADALGEYPAFPERGVGTIEMLSGERSPSLRENIAEGNYGTAALQGLGSLGDAAYLIPGAGAILGPTIGSVLKAPRAVQKLLKASDAAEEGIGSIPQSAAVMPDDDALMAMDFATEMQDLQRMIDDDINMQNPDFLMVLEEHPAVIKGTAALEDIPVTSNDPSYGSMEWDGGRSFNFEDDGRIVVGYEDGVEKLYDRSRKLGFIDDKMEYPGPQPRAEGQKPRAVIVVGPPASGKSSISNPIARKLDATIIDSDEAKKLLPEYQGGVGANAVHKESKRITGMVQDIAVANGDNLVIPTVGDEVETIRKKATDLKDAGYEVDLVDVVVPAKEAKKRMIARFAKTGRIIPFEYLNTVGDNPTKTYDALRAEGVFDGYARIDNSVGFRDAKPLIEDTRELFKGTEVRLQDRRAGGGGRSQESPIPSDSAADLREAEKQRGIGSLQKSLDLTRRVEDASETFGEGAKRVRLTDKETGGTIELLERPDGSASVIELLVPEKFRGQGVGEALQSKALADYPNMGGQVSSKAAATTAYRLGRRPYNKPDATLDDVFDEIDKMSSVNLISPERQLSLNPDALKGIGSL